MDTDVHTAGRLCEGRERDGKACKAKEKPPWPADPQSWEWGPGPPKLGEGPPDPRSWERGLEQSAPHSWAQTELAWPP